MDYGDKARMLLPKINERAGIRTVRVEVPELL
jgi:hypothetical protein